MNNLEEYYKIIPNNKYISHKGVFILYLAYYLEKNNEEVTMSNIKKLYDELRIKSYSNIGQFVKTNSRKFMKGKDKFRYKLTKIAIEEIEGTLNNDINISDSNKLFDLELLNNTREY